MKLKSHDRKTAAYEISSLQDIQNPMHAPPIPLEQSGNYIIRNIDTFQIERVWLNVYQTSIEFDGELLERAAFLSKYAPIEYFPNDSDSSSTPGDPSGGEDME